MRNFLYPTLRGQMNIRLSLHVTLRTTTPSSGGPPDVSVIERHRPRPPPGEPLQQIIQPVPEKQYCGSRLSGRSCCAHNLSLAADSCISGHYSAILPVGIYVPQTCHGIKGRR